MKVNSITGMAASAGKAKDKVRLVHDASDDSSFDDGDILVTEMTDPTMVVMMAKASAIVTDTGGITCHAAIVSREMGIPCVIATKIATKVLSNGQEVLVDGDAGRVTILSMR